MTVIAFSLNLIFKGNLSGKSTRIGHNLITLFGVDCLLIKFDKYILNKVRSKWLCAFY